MKKKLIELSKLILKLAISGLLLYYFFRKSDFSTIHKTVFSISFFSFVLVCIFFFVGIFFNAWKWFVLLPEQNIFYLFRISVVSYFYAFILPGQLFGEVSKILILRKDNETEVIAASVLIDKITSIIGLLAIGVAGLFFSHTEYRMVLLQFMIILLLLCLIFFIMSANNRLYKLMCTIIRKPNISHKTLSDYREKLLFFLYSIHLYSRNYLGLIFNILISIGSQFIGIFSYWFITRQLGFSVSIADWCWIQAALSLALLLPVALGGIGLREGTLVVLLGWVNISHNHSLSTGLILSGLALVLALVGGILELFRIWTAVTPATSK